MLEERLREIAAQDAAALVEAEKSYGSSWRRRGGVGAFMMLARKWDRLETALMPHLEDASRANGSTDQVRVAPWDIFGAFHADQRSEGIIDDIRDLRRYLMLVEEWVTRPQESEDTETAAMRYSQDRAVDEPLTVDVTPTRRYPIHATHAEFESFRSDTIDHGSLRGARVERLYQSGGVHSTHPWAMSLDYRVEYSC